MISKGDLVKMTLSLDSGSNGRTLRKIFVLGVIANYCDEEETYIVEPKAISVPKDQVTEIERLPEDFDFDNVSTEIKIQTTERPAGEPPEISDIRISRSR
jgi:hypothetical protein